MTSRLACWSTLASQVVDKHIFEHYPVDDEGYVESQKVQHGITELHSKSHYTLTKSLLESINHILSDPLFLNTDYEIT